MTRRQRWAHFIAWLVIVPAALAMLALALNARTTSHALDTGPRSGAQP